MRPRRALIVYLLAPLPMVAGLFVLSGGWSFVLKGPILVTAFGLVCSGLSFAAVLKARGTEFQAEGRSALGALAIAGGVLLFISGSYDGVAAIHWTALLLLYDGAVLYIGGTGLLGLVLPPSLALLTIGFPNDQFLDVIALVALTAGNVGSLMVLSRNTSTPKVGCPEYEHYGAAGRSYCLFCGSKIGDVVTRLAARRVGKIVVLSVVLVVASAIPVQVLAVREGTPYASTYSLSGLASSTMIAATNGWSVSKLHTSVVGGVSLARMDLRSASRVVAVDIATSTSSQGAVQVISAAHPLATQIGIVNLGGGNFAQLMADASNSSVAGLYRDSTVDVLNGTQLQTVTMAYFATEKISATSVNGSGLYYITAGSFARVQGAARSSYFVEGLLGNWPTVGYYLSIVGAVFLTSLPFESARREDARRTRFLENTLGLSQRELKVLELISASNRPMTGKELFESMHPGGSPYDKSTFEDALVKLEGLGVLKRTIRETRKGSILLWKGDVRL